MNLTYCDSCVTDQSFFAHIFFYIKYLPRSMAYYYFDPHIKNLMIIFVVVLGTYDGLKDLASWT